MRKDGPRENWMNKILLTMLDDAFELMVKTDKKDAEQAKDTYKYQELRKQRVRDNGGAEDARVAAALDTAGRKQEGREGQQRSGRRTGGSRSG